ncbi:cilia and flagella-associated protein 58-related [Holotrichia oblita]|uniref:Cilia and flagella-associated protein 58-related n=1 Tax=Holotrichia oblita TaxID=644536 RepID=A0ACB9T1U0_HOLOL|nr:cilia and flagella-associated protein 58-related [Holotrichia oblita]
MEESEYDEENENPDLVEEELDPENPQHAFAILERDYTKTVSEIEQNPDLVQYAEEFTKIFEALYKCHENELNLKDRCEELEAKIQEQENLLDAAKQGAKADGKIINDLKDQIQNTWKMADAAHAREQTAQEIIDNLRKNIDSLNAEIDFKNKMGQDNEELGALSKHKEGLQRERDKLVSEVAKLTEKLNNALSYQEELERRTSQADLKINEFAEQIEEQGNEIDRHKRAKEKLENEIKELQETIDKKEHEIVNLNEIITTNQRVVVKLESNLKEQKIMTDKAVRDSETINVRFAKMQDELDSVTYNHDRLKKDFMKRANEIRFKEEEIARLKNEVAKYSKSKEIVEARIKQIEDEKSDINVDREKLRQMIGNMSREIDLMKRQTDNDKRSLEHLTREKEIMNKNMVRQQAVSRDHVKLIKIQEQARRKLVSEIDTHIIEGNKKIKQICYLEKERDRLLEEQLNLTKKIEDYMDEAKLRKAKYLKQKGRSRKRKSIIATDTPEINMIKEKVIERNKKKEAQDMRKHRKIMESKTRLFESSSDDNDDDYQDDGRTSDDLSEEEPTKNLSFEFTELEREPIILTILS